MTNDTKWSLIINKTLLWISIIQVKTLHRFLHLRALKYFYATEFQVT